MWKRTRVKARQGSEWDASEFISVLIECSNSVLKPVTTFAVRFLLSISHRCSREKGISEVLVPCCRKWRKGYADPCAHAAITDLHPSQPAAQRLMTARHRRVAWYSSQETQRTELDTYPLKIKTMERIIVNSVSIQIFCSVIQLISSRAS